MQLTEEQKDRLAKVNVDSERAILLDSRIKRLTRVLDLDEIESEHVNHAINAATSFLDDDDLRALATDVKCRLERMQLRMRLELAGIVSDLLPAARKETECHVKPL